MGDAKLKMKKDLIDELDNYYMNYVYLSDVIAVYNHMEGFVIDTDTTFPNKRIDKISPCFAEIVECALCDSMVMSLMRLYDASSKAKTIPKLIDKCEANIMLFDNLDETKTKIAEFRNKMHTDQFISNAIEVLIQRRDKNYAHNDSKFFGKKIIKDKSRLSMYQIWLLMDFTKEVLNYFWVALTTEEPRKPHYNKDLENLLDRER